MAKGPPLSAECIGLRLVIGTSSGFMDPTETVVAASSSLLIDSSRTLALFPARCA